MNGGNRQIRTPDAYVFGDFRLDLRRRLLLSADGTAVDLTSRVVDTLVCLVSNYGSLVRRDALMDAIWPDGDVEPNNLSQNIAKLRRVLGERPGENRFIETVPGRGYRFVADVRTESFAAAPNRAGSPQATNPIATQRCRQALRLLQRPTADNYRLAVEQLDEVVMTDPAFAPGWAWLADAHLLAFNVGLARPSVLDDVERFTERALELDPELALGHTILGMLSAQRWDWLTAESRLRTACDLDATDAMPRTLHASFVLQQVGHTHRALAELREAHELAPDDPRMLMNLAMSHCIAGADEEATRCARLAEGFGFPERASPLAFVYAISAARAGRYAEGAACAQRLFSKDTASPAVLDLVYDAFVHREHCSRAVEALGSFVDGALPMIASQLGLIPFVAQWFTALDRVDLAFDLISRSIDACAAQGSRARGWQLLWVGELRPLRRHHRFDTLSARLGFDRYWQKSGRPDD